MTGGAYINFGGHEKFILCEFERGTRAREIFPSLDEINYVRSKKSKGFFCRNRKFKRFFRRKTGDLQKKKRSSSQKRHKIWCQSTKNTNLDLDLRSRSLEPVNFFGAQSSLGGAQAVSCGGTAPVCPPVAPGLIITSCASRLKIAIKSRKQPRNTVTAQDRKTYWKGIISNIPNKKAAKLIKQSRLHQSTPNNHNKSIQNY